MLFTNPADFCTNGYPDPDVFWTSVRDYIERAKIALGWNDQQQRNKIRLQVEIENAGLVPRFWTLSNAEFMARNNAHDAP